MLIGLWFGGGVCQVGKERNMNEWTGSGRDADGRSRINGRKNRERTIFIYST